MEINPNVTRIDIERQGDQTLVLEYESGWMPGNPPARFYKVADPFSKSLKWLKELGWDMVEWKIGARAWKFGMSPVRTGPQIKLKRKQVFSSQEWYRKMGVDLTLNLAFYLSGA